MKKTALVAATVLTAVGLTACGSSTAGTYTGDVTNIDTGAKEGTATLELGNKCRWSFTDNAGNTDDARCQSKDGGKKIKLADVKTGQDLAFEGQFNGETLTLQPTDDNKQMMVLTRTSK
ncbi:hypothetical protein V6D40_03355 [Corynebacterium sp. Q4381]|uniref:hypothetical protein n=1 Tax=Corynebacterium sp. Marseille-Q4381 TaxID=3121597 RepID=UPI002FE6B6A9